MWLRAKRVRVSAPNSAFIPTELKPANHQMGVEGFDMSPVSIGWTVFTCVFGGALIGMALRLILPERHLSADSKDVIKMGTGLTATMAALVLALLIASAKSSYDAQRNEVTQIAANVILLDRVLAHYGPETKAARDLLLRYVARAHDQLWPESRSGPAELEPTAALGERY